MLSFLGMSNPQASYERLNMLRFMGKGKTQFEFYSQGFAPSLITDIFDGWKIIKTSKSKAYFHEDTGYTIEFNKGEMNISAKYDTYSFVMPRILDEFITDCERIGLYMDWRIV